jgi:hypothetical protein
VADESRLVIAVLVAAVVATGCRKSSSSRARRPARRRPAIAVDADAEIAATMSKIVAMCAALGTAADRSPDCARVADGLEAVLAEHAAARAEYTALNADPVAKKKASDWMQLHADQIMGPTMQLAKASQQCNAEPGSRRSRRSPTDQWASCRSADRSPARPDVEQPQLRPSTDAYVLAKIPGAVGTPEHFGQIVGVGRSRAPR